jgi:hypothetical protein
MCFSATASFSASGILLFAGAASLSRVTERSQILLASTPIIFSIQQMSEGFLWLTFGHAEALKYQQMLTYVFVTFGQVLWPVWVPLANLLIEKDMIRRKILFVLLGLGSIISSYLLYLTFINRIGVKVEDHHIFYAFNFTGSLAENFSLTYLFPTVFSHFVSSHKKIHVLGVLTFLAFIISKVYYTYFVFSIWCFFASILSAWIFIVMRSMNKEERPCFTPSLF